MATSILLKFLILKSDISRTIWRIELGYGSFFCICYALSFEVNFFSDLRFNLSFSIRKEIIENDNSLVVILLSKVFENEFFQSL